MTPSEQLHLLASAYANKRIAMHKEAIKQQKQTPLDDKVHNGTWIAHYEGYVAGYEAQRPWVGLSSVDFNDFNPLFTAEAAARWADAKLKSKNT